MSPASEDETAESRRSESRHRPSLRQSLRDESTPLTAAAASLMFFALASFAPNVWLAAMLAPLPLLVIAGEVPGREVAVLAFAASLIGSLASWPAESLISGPYLVSAAHLGSAAMFAFFVMLAGDATRRWNGWLAALVYPSFTTTAWFAIGAFSPRGSWANPAYSLAGLASLAQVVAFAGLSGVTFIGALIPAVGAVAWYRRQWNMPWRPIVAVAVIVVALTLALGTTRISNAPTAPAVKVGAAVSNLSIEAFDTTEPQEAIAAVNAFVPIVKQLAERGAQVVVLPEKIVGATPKDEDKLISAFAAMARQDRVWLLAGINEIDRSPQSNVALLFNPTGAVAARYAKRHLAGALEGDYQPGVESAIVDAPWGRTAIAIGEDLDHPVLGNELSMRGVQFVLVPAWDVSGSESIRAPMTSVWAVVNGISVARAAREGVASLVDSRGRTIAQASSRGADPGLAVAELPAGTGATFFLRNGDWLGMFSILATLVFFTRFAVGAILDRSRTSGRVRFEQIEVPVETHPASRPAEAKPEETAPAVLSYKRNYRQTGE